MSIGHTLYRKPWIISVVIALLLSAWLLSGSKAQTGDEPQAEASPDLLVKANKTLVRAEKREASQINQVINLHGRTEASRVATLTAETYGRITEIVVERGQSVHKGDVLVRIDPQDRHEQIIEAEALLKQREMEFDGAKKLSTQGYNAQTRLAEALANLEAAKVILKQKQLDLDYTQIRAPFDGIFNEREVELGDYVSRGGKIGVVIDTDPIVVRGDVAEQNFSRIFVGQQGIAKLITGQSYQGQVRYVSQQSADATHTFRVELAVANPMAEIAVGISSTAELFGNQSLAHKISSAMLSLSESGEIGIKVLVDDNRVLFKPVKVVKTETDGVWVDGLAAHEKIITMGQGFVRSGDQVDVAWVDEANAAASAQSAQALAQ